MFKSGLILGGVTLLIAAVITAGLSPFCTPCFVLFLGLGAGYVTGLFDKPLSNAAASKAGAISGALAGVGAVIGLSLGSAINGVVVGPDRALQMTQSLGLPSVSPADYASMYWVFLVSYAVLCSVLDILIMAGSGALGGLLWWRTTGKNVTNPPAPNVIG